MNGKEYVAIINNITEFYQLLLSVIDLSKMSVLDWGNEVGINQMAMMRLVKGFNKPLRPKTLAKIHNFLKIHIAPVNMKKFVID